MNRPGPKPKPFHERLDRVSKPGCHLWTGKRDRFGYGRVWLGGKEAIASRHAFLLHHGSLPVGLCVLHRCDTPACCNPEHLFLGTRTDNANDKVAKGRARGPTGPNLHAALLTPAQVRTIRGDARSGTVIARDYGVSKSAVNSIKAGRSWKGLP